MAKIQSETEARQGVKGKPVLVVLIAGVALMLIALIGLMTWQDTSAPGSRPDQATTSVDTTPSGSSVPGVNGGNPVNPAPATQKAN